MLDDKTIRELMDNQNELITAVAVLTNKIEYLTEASLKLAKDIESKDHRLDALEKSRIQLMTVVGVTVFAMTTFSGFFLWTVDKLIDSKFEEKLRDADLRYLLCTKYKGGKQIPIDELPKICR